jgi:glycosyltransferase involved in cell wall biosynthesis
LKMLDTLVIRLALPANATAEIVRPRTEHDRCPIVSVIIPCYNYGRYLTQCVNSVLDQEGVRVDLIVIDDASTDGSDQIVRELGMRDVRIRTICHTSNKGHIATYNEGISQVTGEYTVLLSADDLLTAGCLARATSLMEQYPAVGLTYGSPVEFTDDALPPAHTTARSWIIWQGQDWIAQSCKTGENPLKCPEAIVRTSVLREIGGYRSNLPHAADFELWMRAATVSDVGYVVGADQAYYRNHASNMHHSSFDVLDDYTQRLISFDTIFSERSGLLENPDSMRSTAHRTIARIALSQAMRDTTYRAIASSAFNHAIGAYATGVVGDESVDDYIALALKAWPDARQLAEWRALDKLACVRDRPPKLHLSLILRMAMRKIRTRFLLWRRKWTGV